ncbi:cytochrome D1 domain-containing protein [Nocardioides ferulae]|uniref:YVTN family beta-propeller repeat protein n=1 Tax=Nocardioides ferulae TaxID=2340821 RepID=UPI001F0C1377|nr:cytochrome D1 domain-containing protein [Nocardioides ferulae]
MSHVDACSAAPSSVLHRNPRGSLRVGQRGCRHAPQSRVSHVISGERPTMNTAPDGDASHQQRSPDEQEGNRRTHRGLLAAGSLAIVVTAAALVLVNRDNSDGSNAAGRSVTAASSHRGMVEGTVWIANEGGGSLTAIDAATNQVTTTVSGVEGPHNVQVSADGASVWTVSGHDGYAAMVTADSLDLHGVVRTGAAPAHVVVSPDGATAYTTNGADDTVTVIDTATMKPVGTIKVGRGPHGLRPSPDGRWLVVANVADTTLSVIDTRTNRLVTDVDVGKAPAQVAFSPDGRFVYASLNGEDAVAKVDIATRRLVDTVAVGDGPIQTYVSPDNRYLLVANQGTEDAPGTTVSVLDTKTFAVIETVETGQGAHGIVVDPSSRHAYVTNIYGDDVAVLDLEELEVVARIPVGDKPNGVSFSSVTTGDGRETLTLEVPDSAGMSHDDMEDGHDDEGHDGGH